MSASREKKMRKQTQTSASAQNKNKKSLKTVLGVVIALAVIALIVFFTMINTNFFEAHTKVATVGDRDLTAAEVNYWLMDTYQDVQNSMQADPTLSFDASKPLNEQPCTLEGFEDKTWYDYILDEALKSAATTYAIYDEAQKNNFSLSKEASTSIDAQMQSLESMSVMYGFADANAYLTAVYGDGCNAKSYKEYLTVNTFAQEYQAHVLGSFTFDDAELSDYYAEHSDEYDLVRFRVFDIHANTDETEAVADEETAPAEAAEEAIDTAEEAVEGEVAVEDVEVADAEVTAEHEHSDEALAAAEEDANAMMAASINEEEFLNEVINRIPEEERAAYDADSETIQLMEKSQAISYYGEWFEADHTYGDVTVLTSEHGAQVIFFLGTISGDTKLTDVRHILVKADVEEGSYLPTDEAYAVAYEKAAAILEEFNAGDQTEDSFIALANTNTDDPGSAENGGLYEAIDPTQMVTPFSNWAYEGHLPGETGIIKTNYGYHVMFFVGENEARYGTSVAETGLQNEKINEWIEGIEASIKYSIKSTKLISVF